MLFDWDNFFASFLTCLEPRAKAICYSNLIQVGARARTPLRLHSLLIQLY